MENYNDFIKVINNFQLQINQKIDKIHNQQTETNQKIDKIDNQQTETNQKIDKIDNQQTETNQSVNELLSLCAIVNEQSLRSEVYNPEKRNYNCIKDVEYLLNATLERKKIQLKFDTMLKDEEIKEKFLQCLKKSQDDYYAEYNKNEDEKNHIIINNYKCLSFIKRSTLVFGKGEVDVLDISIDESSMTVIDYESKMRIKEHGAVQVFHFLFIVACLLEEKGISSFKLCGSIFYSIKRNNKLIDQKQFLKASEEKLPPIIPTVENTNLIVPNNSNSLLIPEDKGDTAEKKQGKIYPSNMNFSFGPGDTKYHICYKKYDQNFQQTKEKMIKSSRKSKTSGSLDLKKLVSKSFSQSSNDSTPQSKNQGQKKKYESPNLSSITITPEETKNDIEIEKSTKSLDLKRLVSKTFSQSSNDSTPQSKNQGQKRKYESPDQSSTITPVPKTLVKRKYSRSTFQLRKRLSKIPAN
eukprot:TRINITY_DN2530_c0_g1_i1.p1 TRINITY_DN2530_c0_g1~~TRINITY_DN2530_c0_g1_i1.p1  ORF type:complete len:467 (+),score=122.47 TRINITY_DN2530_c0_g1_i1:1-1401(+)